MSATASLPAKTLLGIYRTALKIQLIDEKVRGLLMSGRMAAVFYSPRGQEILAAAMAANLQPTDYIVTTYRGMHDQVAKGIPLRQLFAEYYGKATGTCKGKGDLAREWQVESAWLGRPGLSRRSVDRRNRMN